MCGIAGYWSPAGLQERDASILDAMTGAIRSRGPDDGGSWLDPVAGVALGHRRLAIIDLSPAGHQPMASPDGRYVLVYNGEIYNFQQLRTDLDRAGGAPAWRGSSDTEVLLASIAHRGVLPTLQAVNGMFAFALWDRLERTLTLARDRMGEKPLYWSWQGQGDRRTFIFGSDLSSFHQHPVFAPEIDSDGVALLTRYLHIPEPHSIYRNVAKLMPGTIMTVQAGGSTTETRYWDSLVEYAACAANPFTGSADEAVDALSDTLTAAVRRQAIADVPLGTFLSGGIDSSTVTALLQSVSNQPVKTFCIGFSQKDYDESGFAKGVARHLGTEHHELIVTPQDAQSVIPNISDIYSEPFADSSQIPTFLVSRLARQHVTVSLSGDGGDELFAGYNRHVYGQATWSKLARIPRPLRAAAAGAMRSLSPHQWDATLGRLLAGRVVGLGEKLHKSAGAICAVDGDDLYRQFISINQQPDNVLARPSGTDGFEHRSLSAIADLSLVDRMMALDAVHYLPGDILTKVDRAAMANSLETRVPMLDVDVMRLAWSIPASIKLNHGIGKWPLRQLLYRHVPAALVDRPKQGFGIPIHAWLRGALRPWAEELLNSSDAPLTEFYDVPAVMQLWREHLSGRRNNQHQIWPILMFQSWRLSLASRMI